MVCGGESRESDPFPASVPVGEWRFSAGWWCGYLHGFESRLALWPESELERMQLILPFFEKVQILFEAFKDDDDMLLLVRCGA